MLIPAIGAVAGAALKPSNPLQGALLGAAAGYTGGQALGLTGVAPAVAPAASAVSNPLLNSQIAAQAAQPALSYAGGNIANAAASTLPNSAAGLSFAGMSPSAANVVNTTPSLLDKAGMYATSAYENPVATGQTIASVNSLLQPEPMPSPAPTMPLQAGRGVKPYDPIAYMDPYKQSVVGSPQVSLI
jgi:hypothetical protein